MLKKFLLNEKIQIQFLFAGLPEVFFGLRLVKRQLNQVTLGARNGTETGLKGAERLMTVRNNHVAAYICWTGIRTQAPPKTTSFRLNNVDCQLAPESGDYTF